MFFGSSASAQSSDQADDAIAARSRSEMLDALRGVALLGILLVNISYFSGWWDSPRDVHATQWGNAAAPAVAFLLEWLVAGKFYSLFSLMFGVGFAIQLERLRALGSSVGIYVKRLVLLFGFGIAHMLLFWMGDILALYALMGLVLLLFRKASDEVLLLAAAIAATAPILWSAAIQFGGFNPSAPLSNLGMTIFRSFGLSPTSPVAAWAQPNYLLHVKAHLAEIFFNFSNLLFELRPAKVLSMFLVGYWVGRHLVGLDLAIPSARLRKLVAIGLAIGLPLSAISAGLAVKQLSGLSPAESFIGEASSSIGTPALALAYGAIFVLLWRGGGAMMLGIAAPAGRMALTNYLGQSAIQCVLFFGWGFALVGRLSIAILPLIAAAVFLLQIVISREWLRRFGMGPFEWLWRSMTVGRVLPLRAA